MDMSSAGDFSFPRFYYKARFFFLTSVLERSR